LTQATTFSHKLQHFLKNAQHYLPELNAKLSNNVYCFDNQYDMFLRLKHKNEKETFNTDPLCPIYAIAYLPFYLDM